MHTISFDEPINIKKNHFKNLEDFQLYIIQKLQNSELSEAHKEILDTRMLEVNENPENYISLKELKSSTKTKTVRLEIQTLSLLKIQAENEGEKLINYMEKILTNKANDFELSDDYKLMMDDLLEKHDKGELDFLNEETFFKSINR